MRKLPLLVALLWAGMAVAADPPRPLIDFPDVPAVQPPTPMPSAAGVLVLKPGKVLAVQAAVECFVYPDTPLLNVEVLTGPTNHTANFVENATDRLTTRKYDKPFVYVITAADGADGSVDLLFVPFGIKNKAEVVLRTIQVGKGKPVEPDVKPPPKPVDPPKTVLIPDAGFYALFVYESEEVARYSEGQRAVLTSQDVRKYLYEKKAVARFADKDATDLPPPLQKALEAVKNRPLPLVVLAKDGKDGTDEPLPPSIPEALSLLKKYGGN